MGGLNRVPVCSSIITSDALVADISRRILLSLAFMLFALAWNLSWFDLAIGAPWEWCKPQVSTCAH